MSNLNSPVSKEDIAFLIMTGAGVVTTARGCSAVRFGAGVYDITLDAGNGVNDAQMSGDVLVKTTGLTASLVSTSDTVKRLSVVDAAGAAADGDFSLSVGRVA
jgi:hypothetical protein